MNSTYIIIIFVTLIIVVSFLPYVFKESKRYDKIEGILKREAKKRNGKMHLPGLLNEVEFFMLGNLAYLGMFSRPQEAMEGTILKVKLKLTKDIHVAVSYEPDFIISGLKLIGLKDIKINNLIFDDTFFVRGHPKDVVLNLFDSEIQNGLLKYKETPLKLTITKKKLYLNLSKMLRVEEELDDFVNLTALIVKKLA